MTTLQTLKNIIPYVKPYKWLVGATLTLTLIGSCVAQVNAIVLNYTVDAINALVEAGKGLAEGLDIMFYICVILLSKELLSVGVTFGQRFFGEKMRISISQDLSEAVIVKMLTYKLAFFSRDGNEAGKLQTRINRGVDSLTRMVQNFFIDILPLFVSAILAIVLMFKQNLYVGLTALFIVPIYFWITYRQACKLKGWREMYKTYYETKSHGIMNIIESINVIKSFNREQIEGEKQLSLLKKITDNQMRTRKTAFAFDSLKTFVEQIGVVLIIILTAYLVLNGEMTIGAIMYHIMLFGNVSAPIRQLHRIYDDLNDALIYAGGYFDIMNSDHERENSGNYRPEKIKGTLELRGVDFTYPNGTKALHNINMTIESGKITALVGLSGAGKSTIVNLLDKFYDPDCGQVLLDGVDLREWDTKYLRDHIGLVLQKNHIFDGTIEDNIRYGNPDASDEEVIEAAKKAYLYDQVSALPNGFKSKATELSGGQQQRVAIARMFIKNPPIIFLDEPTASLDAIATEQIKNSIDAIKKDRTVIIISHSLSQIIDSETIYSLEKGRVMEHGTHEECYDMNGVYRKIFDASARSLNIEKIAKTMEEDNGSTTSHQ
ncbi:MAG: ABC transporter ATP-binding protein/permease [Bacteroidales bacterium]|nr:ABC transporter ATP-binding protein/permease [Bacteroidales bacterium]